MIDQITDALGDQKAFAAASGVVFVALIVGLVVGKLAAVASIATLVTVVMVFVVPHTSSRESRALNVKLDELIRVTSARNELIGAEGSPSFSLRCSPLRRLSASRRLSTRG